MSLLTWHSDIYFIGGFGTVAWVDVKEYEGLKPDKIAADSGEQNLKVSFTNCYIFYTKWLSFNFITSLILKKVSVVIKTLALFLAFDLTFSS